MFTSCRCWICGLKSGEQGYSSTIYQKKGTLVLLNGRKHPKKEQNILKTMFTLSAGTSLEQI